MRRLRFDVPLPTGGVLRLGQRTLVMAIVNVTPDSFSDGGLRYSAEAAVADALRLVEQGADILDIGGESTRPGADPLPLEEEWRRVGPVIAALRRETDIPLSIDTYKAETARRALDSGAAMVNDISGFTADPEMAHVVAASGAAAVLMHHRGRSDDMYAQARYDDVVGDVCRELLARASAAEAAGVGREKLILDPGFGFAKRAEQSMQLLAGLPALGALGYPVLSGPSRKSFLQLAVGERPPLERVWATAAAVAASIWQGAHIVRVHDVAAMVDVVRVTDRCVEQSDTL